MALKTCCCLILLVSVVGCGGGSGDTIEKAQIAVRANPGLELVATDERQGVLTVKVVRSGRVMTVNAGEVVAGTAFRGLENELTGQAPTTVPPNQTGQDREMTASRVRGPGEAGPPAATPSAGVAGERARVAVDRSGSRLAVDAPSGRVEVDRGNVTARGPAGTATVTREAGPATAQAARVEAPTAAVTAVPPATAVAQAGKGAVIDESRLKRRTNPVACLGREVVELNGVLLRSEGVAVMTSGGCEVRITNSRIAGQVAVQVAGGGTVSIENSIIEGAVAMQLTGGAVVSLRSSTILGPVQRAGAVTVRDLGGNLYK
jgi:hypothetical protein